MYYLLKHPPCLQKLRDEVNQLQTGEKMPGKNVTFKDTQDMPYLQAVIKEGLRIHPATALPLERVVPEGGATISGRFFPEGVRSTASQSIVQDKLIICTKDYRRDQPVGRAP